MSEVLRAGTTTIVRNPTWNGRDFDESIAQSFWAELPPVLHKIALAEIEAGNNLDQILRNDERGIVLVGFEQGPLAGEPPAGIIVHSRHRYGNYCYDGTKCTYEDSTSGSFLAFNDPVGSRPNE
jgi:hypothetical protein